MKDISSFLARYKRLTPPNMAIRDSVVSLLESRLSYEISREQVKVRGRIVYINCPSIVKSEILFNKKELIEELLKNISPHVIDDIR
ncbi:MAG: hypothetical protein U5L75_03090 [Candidatus Campbellbacteria bacterium]|nr:hypothetical protein [Candidatus Campbellbacteria bacterium]